MDRRLVLMLRR